MTTEQNINELQQRVLSLDKMLTRANKERDSARKALDSITQQRGPLLAACKITQQTLAAFICDERARLDDATVSMLEAQCRAAIALAEKEGK